MMKKILLALIMSAFAGMTFSCKSNAQEGKETEKNTLAEDLNPRLEETYTAYNTNDRNLQKEQKDLLKKFPNLTCVSRTEHDNLYVFSSVKLSAKDAYKKQGLLSSKGEVLLQPEYEMIGNPGTIASGIVEIKKGGKFGLFDYINNILVQPQFDYIIPVGYAAYAAIGFRDGRKFKIMDDGQLKLLEDEKNPFEYLSDDRKSFNARDERFAKWFELNKEEDSFSGSRVYLPSYLSVLNQEEREYISLTLDNEEMGTESYNGKINEIRRSGRKYKSILYSFVEKGVFGRDYLRNEYLVNSFDEMGKRLDKKKLIENYGVNFYCNGAAVEEEMKVRYINDTLLELKYVKVDYEPEFTDRDTLNYTIATFYSYFSIRPEGKIVALGEQFKFPMAGVVKLTEDYLKGTYVKALPERENEEPYYEIRSFLSLYDLQYMKNQILASKGYIFQDTFWKNVFFVKKWYKMIHKDVSKLLTPVEKENIRFLDEWIDRLQKEGEQKYLKSKIAICGFAG